MDTYANGGVADQVSELINQARPFIEAGDGRNALLILEAVAEPYVDHWVEFDDSDGVSIAARMFTTHVRAVFTTHVRVMFTTSLHSMLAFRSECGGGSDHA
jgi:hypothetical protein